MKNTSFEPKKPQTKAKQTLYEHLLNFDELAEYQSYPRGSYRNPFYFNNNLSNYVYDVLNPNNKTKTSLKDSLILADWTFKNLFDADIIVDINFYPWRNQKAVLENITNKQINLNNEDLLIVDKKHPEQSPFLSIMGIKMVLSVLDKFDAGSHNLFYTDELFDDLESVAYEKKYKGWSDLIDNRKTIDDKLLKRLSAIKNKWLDRHLDNFVATFKDLYFKMFNLIDDYIKYVTIKNYVYFDVEAIKDALMSQFEDFENKTDELREDITAENIKNYEDNEFLSVTIFYDYQCICDDIIENLKTFFYNSALPLINTKKFQHHYLYTIDKTIDNFNKNIQSNIYNNTIDDIAKYYYFYDNLQEKIDLTYNHVRFVDNNIKSNKEQISIFANDLINKKDLVVNDLIDYKMCDLCMIYNYILEKMPYALINKKTYWKIALDLCDKDSYDIKERLSEIAFIKSIQNDDLNVWFRKKDSDGNTLLSLNTDVYNDEIIVSAFSSWDSKNRKEPGFNENSILFLKDKVDNKCYSLNLKYDNIKDKMLDLHKTMILLAKIKTMINFKDTLLWWTSKVNEDKLDASNKDYSHPSYEDELDKNKIRR